jgi:hypothetical protein
MANSMQATMQSRIGPNFYRTTAAIVGAVYLAGLAVYITGSGLVQSILGAPDHLSIVPANSVLLAIGAMLMLMSAVGDAAHGVLMFPVLKRHNERLALGYFAARIIDAGLIALGILLILVQIPLGREYLAGVADASSLQALSTLAEQAHLYTYDLGMIAVGFAGLMLCYTFFWAQLLPRPLAIWGLVGYGLLLGGMVSEVLGSGLGLAFSIPGGLWELFIGVWLIVKGFKSPAMASESATTDVPGGGGVMVPAAATL